MGYKKLFLRLKNEKSITLYFKRGNDSVTVEIRHENNLFTVHSYIFDGNDVMDDHNYREEITTSFADYDELVNNLKTMYVGIDLEIQRSRNF